jgi:hypothetical protein
MILRYFDNTVEMETKLSHEPIVVDYHQAIALETLSNFLKVKGLFLLAYDNPGFKEAEGGKFYYTLLSYLEKQTNIIQIPFWIELEKERTRKLECCKHFVLLTNFGKVHLDTPEMMSVFIMMCGNITVVNHF